MVLNPRNLGGRRLARQMLCARSMRLAWFGLLAAGLLWGRSAGAQSLGLGVRASSVRYEESQHSEGLGALARLRLPHLELELEVGHEPHAGSDRRH